MIRGVIFDKDGVMIDTERLFQSLWCEIMRDMGQEEHREAVTYCIGLNHQAIKEYLDREFQDGFDYWSVLREVDKRTKAIFASEGIPVKTGLYPLLDGLDSAGIPWAVATSSHRETTLFQLERIGVLDRAGALVTGDMVARGKPDPDIFLQAAKALSLPPEECLVLEDSPHGILAASLAGCLPVMIPDLKEPDAETEKLLFARLPSLDQVMPLLRAQGAVSSGLAFPQ